MPRNVSPAAERRRALLLDVVLGVFLGLVVIVLAAGIGVVGFIALLGAIALAVWYLLERGMRTLRRRRRP